MNQFEKQRRDNKIFFAVLRHLDVLHYLHLLENQKETAARYAEYEATERAEWTVRTSDEAETAVSVPDDGGTELFKSEAFQSFHTKLVESLDQALDQTCREVSLEIGVMAKRGEIHVDSVTPLKQVVAEVHQSGVSDILENMHSVASALSKGDKKATDQSLFRNIDLVYREAFTHSYSQFERGRETPESAFSELVKLATLMRYLQVASSKRYPSTKDFSVDVLRTSGIFSRRMAEHTCCGITKTDLGLGSNVLPMSLFYQRPSLLDDGSLLQRQPIPIF